MATPFSTWFKIMDCFESATSLVNSTPLLIGPGCMMTISLLIEFNNSLLIPNNCVYSLTDGKYLISILSCCTLSTLATSHHSSAFL